MASAGGTVFGTAKAIITLDIGGVIRGAQQANQAFQSITSSAGQMSNNSGRSLRSMSEEAVGVTRGLSAITGIAAGIGGGIAAGLGAAAKEFIGFNQVIQNIASLGKDAASSVGALQPKLFELATTMGKSPTELADALYTVASAGFSTADSLTIITASTRAAVAGLTTVGTAADLISSALLSYGLTADHAEHVSNVLFATVQVGKVRFEQLATTLGILLPVAKVAGVSLEEVGAAMAALTNQGLSARQAAQQLNSLFQSLIKPSAALSAALQLNGFESGQALIAAKGLGGAMTFLSQVTGDNATNMAKLLTNQRAARAAFLLTGDGAEQYAKALEATTHAQDGAGATQKSLDEQMKSTAFIMAQAKASFQVLADTIGAKLAPAINIGAHYLAIFVQGLTKVFDVLDKFGLATPLLVLVGFVGVVALAITAVGGFMLVMIRVTEAMGAYAAATKVATTSTVGLRLAAITGSGAMGGTTAGLTQATGAAKGLGLAWKGLSALGPLLLIASVAVPLTESFVKQAHEGGSFWGTTFAVDAQRLIGAGLGAFGSQGLNQITDKWRAQIAAQDFAIKVGLHLDTTFFIGAAQGEAGKATVKELGRTIDDLTKSAKAANQTFGDYVLSQLKAAGASTETITKIQAEIDAEDGNTDATNEHAAALQQQAQEYQDLSDIIDSLGKKTTKADDAFKQAKVDANLSLPLSETAEAFKSFTGELNQLVSDTLAKLGTVTSVADPISFLTSQIDKSATTVSGLFLRMHDLGVGLDFTPAEVQALKLNAAMEDVDNHLKALSDTMDQNNQDIAMWQGRISLVDSILGENKDTLSDYNAQLANGEITQKAYNKAIVAGSAHVAQAQLNRFFQEGKINQQQFNEISEAGIHIQERAAGGIQDELLAQAKLLPALDRWITAHDRADGAIHKLSDSQQAFLSVLNESNTKQALATVQMVSYLASIGQVPPAAVTKVVADLSDADPKLHAIFDELGLLKTPTTIQVKANIDEATQKLHDIGVQKDALLAEAATLRVELAEDPNNEAIRKKIKDTQDAVTALDGRQATISTAIQSGDADKVKTALADEQKAVDALNATPIAPGSTAPTVAPNLAGSPAAGAGPAIDIKTQVLNPDGSPSNNGVQGVIDAMSADIADKQASVSVGVALGPPPLDFVNQVLADAETKLASNVRGVVTTLDNQVFDTSTMKGFTDLQNHIQQLKDERINIQVAVDDPDKARVDADVTDQIALLQASRDRIVAALQEQASHPGVINDLSQTQSIVLQKIAALKAVASPSSQQLQDLQALQTYLLEINQQLSTSHEFQISPDGAAKALDLMQRVAAITGAVVQPKDITIDTDRAGAALLNLQNQIVTIDGTLAGLRTSAKDGGADAQAALDAAIAKRDALVAEKAIVVVTMDPSQFNAEAAKIDAQIQNAILSAQKLRAATEADPGNKTLGDQLNVSDATIQRLETSRLILEAIASGNTDTAFATFGKEFDDLGAKIKANPLFTMLTPAAWSSDMTALFSRYEALGELVTDTSGKLDKSKFDAAIKATLGIQTEFLGSPEEIAAARAAANGTPLPGAAAPITPTLDQQKLLDALNKIKAGAADLNAQGQVEFKANGLREAQAALHAMHGDAALTLDDFKKIDFNINGEHTSAFTNFLNETHDKLGETFGPKYTAFLDANGDGVITNTDLAKKGLEDIAKRWTAFISADSTTAQDTIDFIEQRLVDLGNPELTGGGHGIDIKANADEALAVIKGLNTKIDDSKLNGTLLAKLDANGDGFLSAVELARVTGKNLEDHDFVASIEAKVNGGDAAKTELEKIKNVVVDLTDNPGVVQVTAKSDADVQKFLDANQTQLAGKTISVTITNPDGSIKSIQEFQFSGKIMTVTVNDAQFQVFRDATIELDQNGVSFDIIANDADAAQKLIDVNAKELKGKTVQVFVRDEATGALNLLETKKISDKDIKVNADTTEIDNLNSGGKAKTVTVDADTKPATDAAAAAPAAVQNEIDKQPKPVVTVTSQVEQSSATATGAGFPVSSAGDIGAIATEAAAAAQTAVTGITAALAALPAQLGAQATLAGAAYATGLATALGDSGPLAANALNPLINFLGSLANETYNPGFNVGFDFDYGIAGGIIAGSTVIENAAQYAALVAYYAAKGALGIHSPSTKGAELGGFFTLGVADGVLSKADEAARASRSVAQRMAAEFASVKAKPMTLTGILGAGPGASASDTAAARKAFAGPGLPAVIVAGGGAPSVSITVPGAGDPKAVGSEVYRRFIDAANRIAAGNLTTGAAG